MREYVYFLEFFFELFGLLLQVADVFDSHVVEHVLFPVEVEVIESLGVVLGIWPSGTHMVANIEFEGLGLEIPDSSKDISLNLGDPVIESRMLCLGCLPLPQHLATHLIFMK